MGFAKGRESRCDGNLGLFSLWATWIVAMGWIFTRPGQSSVAVGQQKSLSMNLWVTLPGSCQKSRHATHLFSWCFACWKHWVCVWVWAQLLFPMSEQSKCRDVPARCQSAECQGVEEVMPMWDTLRLGREPNFHLFSIEGWRQMKAKSASSSLNARNHAASPACVPFSPFFCKSTKPAPHWRGTKVAWGLLGVFKAGRDLWEWL